MPEVSPHWERGYRCHGYWIGNERIGFVALTPRGPWPTEYHWGMDCQPNSPSVKAKSLHDGKRSVEKTYAEQMAKIQR